LTTVPVSVIVPFRDTESHADAAFNSVHAQTVAPAEIVIVDDGSGPAGRAWLDQLLEEQPTGSSGPSYNLVRMPGNRGPGPARNAGVAASTQPYIAFLDADDIWVEHKLERQYALMHAWPELDATHTDAVSFLADGSELKPEPRPRRLTVDTALHNHVMLTPSIMMKRTSFDRLGGFDPAFRCTQDWEMQIRMALAGYQVQFIPDVLVRVRRQGQPSHSSDWRCYLEGHLRILWKHRVLYRERGGMRGWIHRAAFEIYRAGTRRGGVLGRCLEIPYRVGV
jgi:glycosyltransferase involved in cell wall biosynthesis